MTSTNAAGLAPCRDWWPAGPAVAIIAGIAILALPADLEGPALLPISPGHALSLVDVAGVVPLAAGSTWLHADGSSTHRISAASRPGCGCPVDRTVQRCSDFRVEEFVELETLC